MKILVSIFRLVFIVLAFILVEQFFYKLVNEKISLIRFESDQLVISDFAYHLVLAKAFWFEQVSNIYSIGGQLSAIKKVLGFDFSSAMPVGVFPTAFVLWYPFAFFFKLGVERMFAIWIALSLVFLGYVFISFVKKTRLLGTNFDGQEKIKLTLFNKLKRMSLFLIVICSFSFTSAAMLGQTSLISLAALIGMLVLIFDKNRNSFLVAILLSILMFLLSVKPPYLLIGFTLLLSNQRWKAIFGSVLLIATGVLAFNSYADTSLYSDYLNNLSFYFTGEIPPWYRDSIQLSTMNTFVSNFHLTLGKEQVFFISSVISSISVWGVLIYSGFKSLTKLNSNDSLIVFPSLFLASVYLLFSPYVGGYEEILIMFIFCLVFVSSPKFFDDTLQLLVVAIATFITLNFMVFNAESGAWLYWVIKLCVMAELAAAIIWESSQEKS